jgi:signal transduction histidine kinase
MAGRVFLILVCGIVTSTALTWWFAFGERQRALAQFREARAVEQAEQFIRTLDELPPAERHGFLRSTRRFGLKVELLNNQDPSNSAFEPGKGLGKVLSDQLGDEYQVLSLPASPVYCAPVRTRHPDTEMRPPRVACEAFKVQLKDATEVLIAFFQPRGNPQALRPDINIYLLFFLASIAALAYLVSRIATSPLRQLAQAAADLGNNIDHPPLQQKGTSEIRQATTAFNAMQERIKGHIRQRTHMLAAITHDLQTPLTRLRLRLEKVDDPALKEKLIEDLSHTQALVREGLDLARSMDSAEPMQSLDIDSLIDSLCSDAADAGQPVSFHGRTGAFVRARPIALRRCLINLLDNAVKYGGSAEITTSLEGTSNKTQVCISIADFGPGIPPEEMQRVFEPFYRLENSRSRQTGGTGLGLTIAQNIIMQHGGSLVLKNRKEGGLEALLTLPATPPN